MMSDQELKFLQEEDTISNSMLHLSTAAHHHHANATLGSLDKYAASYSNSTKRQSPSQFQEPVSKRATLHPSSPPCTAAAIDNHLIGFTKLALPHSFPADSPPPLRRTFSEPIYSPSAANSVAPPPTLPEFPTPPCPITNQTRQENPNRSIVQELPQFLNPVAILHRTVSDPSPVVHHQAAGAASSTPPRPPVGRNASRSPSCVESPSTKRLKRMRERLKEMSQWWNQVVSEDDDEEEEEEPEYYCCDNNGKEESERVEEIPSQEAVWVEKKGECLILHFKCPCGNGYQILLSGKNCYYKLTNL